MALNARMCIERRMAKIVAQKIIAEGGDGVFSPTGLGIAAAVVLSMSAGTSRDEACMALGLSPMNELEFCKSHQTLHQELNTEKDGATLNLTNGLFVRGVVNDSYKDTCKTYFNATSMTLESKAAVNLWVAGQTDYKITELLTSEPSATVFVSCMLFKGVFDIAFDKDNTRLRPFYPDFTAEEPGDRTLVPTMHKTELVSFVQCEAGKVVKLPYGEGSYSLIILLPDTELGLSGAVATLLGDWDNVRAAMCATLVELEVPKFDLKFDFDASDALKKVGIKEAFLDGSADLGRLTKDKSTYVEKVVQSATFSLDEKGVEAAVATAVVCASRGGGGARRKQTVSFAVNRPALFMVVEGDIDAMLFVALVSHPEVEKADV